MNLLETLEAIEESRLSRAQLEDYDRSLTLLYAQLIIESGKLEKREMHYMREYRGIHGETPDIRIVREWKLTEDGERQIDVKGDLKILTKALSLVKSQIYQTPNY